MALRIGGVLIQKNQGHRILSNVIYHLDVAKFDQLIVVDNDSFDNSLEMLKALNHPRLEVISTGRQPFHKGKFIRDAALRLVEKHNIDWVFPIDADYLWVAVEPQWGILEDFRGALERENCLNGFDPVRACLYSFYPHWSFLDRLEKEPELLRSYKEQWWKYLVLRHPNPGTVKAVICKDAIAQGFELVEGEHAALHPQRNELVRGNQMPAGIRCYEAPQLSHDDFVRHALNIAVGRMGVHGYNWVSDHENETAVSRHAMKWLRRLMVDGNLEEIMKTMYSVNDETIVPEHGKLTTDEQFLYDTSLMELDIPVPEGARNLERLTV